MYSKKYHQIYLFVFILILSISSPAKVLLLELIYDKDDPDNTHGEQVQWSACPNNPKNCDILYNKSFIYDQNFNSESQTFLEEFDNKYILQSHVVNMSFSAQKPKIISEFAIESADFTRDPNLLQKIEENKEAHKKFQVQKRSFLRLFEDHPNKLFVAAAGNGIRLMGLYTLGVSIDLGRNQLYPASHLANNLIKVASYNTETDNLYDYSNYGLELVDLAISPAMDNSGTPLIGTSFAAPVVSAIADKILTKYPQISISNVKEILIKSCRVKNVQSAINATKDIMTHGKKSEYYIAMSHRKRAVRNKLHKKYSDIVYVKSGGELIADLALLCAKKLNENNLSISEACLLAHKELQISSTHETKLLTQLWKLRGL